MSEFSVEDLRERFYGATELATNMIDAIDKLSLEIDTLQNNLLHHMDMIEKIKKMKDYLKEKEVLYCNLKLLKHTITHEEYRKKYVLKLSQRDSLKDSLDDLCNSMDVAKDYCDFEDV